MELKEGQLEERSNFKEYDEDAKAEGRAEKKTEAGMSQEDKALKSDDDYIALAVDGEIYKIKNGKRLNISLDPVLPRIRMLRRIKQERDMDGMMEELLQYGLPFV